MQAHTPNPSKSMNTKSTTFYQQEQKNPMTSPEQPEFYVEIRQDRVKISGEISGQQLQPFIKPIVLLITHLTTAGITWASTLQNQPTVPNPPAIGHCQPSNQ
jgi:hypothetical protein